MSSIFNQLVLMLNQRKLSALKNSQFPVTLVNLLAIVMLASMLAKITWQALEPDVAVQTPITDHPTIPGSIENTVRIRSVSGSHLFGKPATQPVVTNAPIVAPDTRLRLKLKGVFASEDPEQAYAIIEENNKDKAYKLGSKVSASVVLHAVYPDKVILKRNGRLETLRLEKPKLDNKNGNIRPLSQVQAHNTSTHTVASHAKIRQLKKTLLTNPQQLWNQVRIQPVLANGRIKGYTVEHKDKQLMELLTLQKGDVVVAVEGKPLSDPASLYGLTKQISSKNNISITIERGGVKQDIQVHL